MLIPEQYRETRQRILDPQPGWLESVKREFPVHGETFFVAQDMVTQNYMLLGWAHRPKKLFVALAVLGETPAPMDFMQRHSLKMLIDPPQAADSDEGYLDPLTGQVVVVLTPEKMAKMQKEAQNQEARDTADDFEELLDLKRHLHRKALARGKGDSMYWADVADRTLIPQKATPPRGVVRIYSGR